MFCFRLTAFALIIGCCCAFGQGPGGPPVVITAPAQAGVLAPQSEFRGTVYFKAISQVATEVGGKVIEVPIEVGQHVEKGQVLARLDDTLLQKDLQAAKANHARYAADLEDIKVQYERARQLLEQGLTPTQEFDQLRFQVQSLQHQVESVGAEVERTQTLIQKYSIHAPFSGVILERKSEVGEWMSSGDPAATVAREHDYDVIVNTPEDVLRWAIPGAHVPVDVGGRRLDGEVVTVVPRGDIATQTFPIKIRVTDDAGLYEGMSALVRLPVGPERECLLVPRDAVLNEQGKMIAFTIDGDASKKHEVKVLGYDGDFAGVEKADFSPSVQFIIKGQERLRGGEKVAIAPPSTPDTARADG